MIINDGGNIARGAVNEASRLAGLRVPYLWGGNSLAGMDCSGMVQWCMSVGGYPNLPKDRRMWTTATLRALGTTIPNGTQKPGDLIFPDIGHVGIYVGGTNFIDAPTTGIPVGIHDYTKYNNGSYAVVRIVDPTTTTIINAGVTATGSAQATVQDPITAALAPLTSFINSLTAPLTWLTTPENWIRIAMVLGGSILLLGGVIFLEASS